MSLSGNSDPTPTSKERWPATLRSLGPIVATAIVVLFLLVSAIPLMHWFEAEGRLSTLEENRALWQELGLSDYRMTLEYEGPGHVGAVTIAYVIRKGQVSERSGLPLPLETIDALFERLDEAVRETPADLLVSYDEDYGFPRNIQLDSQTVNSTRYAVIEFDPRTDPPSGSAGDPR